MIFNLPFLLLGLGLLWFPRSWMRLEASFLRPRRRRGERGAPEPWKSRPSGDPRIMFADEFKKARNYVDFARACVGGLAVMGGMGLPPAIDLAADASRSASLQRLVLQGAILLIAVTIQCVRLERTKVTFYPPIFFLTGLSIALCGWRGAAFAFVMIWTLNAAFGNAQAFLAVYGLLMFTFGLLIGRAGWFASLLAGGLCFTPVLYSLLANRPLVVFSRKGTRAAT